MRAKNSFKMNPILQIVRSFWAVILSSLTILGAIPLLREYFPEPDLNWFPLALCLPLVFSLYWIAEKRRKAFRFDIIFAVYGKWDGIVDCKEALQKQVCSGRLEVKVDDNLAGDPLEGHVKQLKVIYIENGKVRERIAGQRTILAIP
jgi:hypothetical protein